MVDCTVGVAGTGQTSAGPVGEVPLLAVLALKAGVAALTRTLTSVWVTVVRIQNALGSAAAVTNHLLASLYRSNGASAIRRPGIVGGALGDHRHHGLQCFLRGEKSSLSIRGSYLTA